MPFFSAALALGGLGASAAGGVMSFEGQQTQISAEKSIAAQNQQQQLLDAARQRRNIARQAIISRATALSNATSQGGGFGSSSGVAGGMAGIESQAQAADLAVNQNSQIATNEYGSTLQELSGASEAATGSGISSFGSMLMNNAQTFGKVGSYVSGGGNFGWGSGNGIWGTS